MLSRLWSKIRNLDPILFACTSFLSFFSIGIVYGSVENFGRSKLIMQIAMTLAGMVFTVIVANINYRWLVDKAWLIMLLFSVGILGVTLVFGSSGATMETSNKSWLTIPVVGIAIQPSEFVKITFICTFARHLYVVREKINRPLVLLGLALHAGTVIGLILLSGDLGVAMVYIGFVLVMLFAAGMSLWYDAGLAAVCTVAFPFLYNNYLSDYQIKRIYYGFRPEEDPVKWGWQALFSKKTIQNGEFLGRGIMSGGFYESLSASHTDFIFATVCEKTGFVGGTLVILALCGIVLRTLAIARDASGEYGALIAIGVAAVIIVQTAENIAMTFALVPVVGITLPFVSCGGSSLFATFILVALVHSVAATQKRLDA